MLVKAKWNVKDASGWHSAGDVFNTDSDLGDAVEVLEVPKAKVVEAVKPASEPEKKPEPEKEEVKAEKPKTSARRRTTK